MKHEAMIIEEFDISTIKNNGSTVAEPLQVVPNYSELEQEVMDFVKGVLRGKKISREKFNLLSNNEKKLCKKMFEAALKSLAFDDKDQFVDRIDELLPPDVRRNLWEINHIKILNVINQLTHERGRFPTRTEISKETGISRVTINRHLKEYHCSDEYAELQDEFLLMREKLLARIFAFGVNGNIKAAKLFLEVTGNQSPITRVKNQQNNLIQINGLTITNEQICQLPADKQKQIQDIITMIKPSHIRKKCQGI